MPLACWINLLPFKLNIAKRCPYIIKIIHFETLPTKNDKRIFHPMAISFYGLIVGLCTFLIIGLFHPLVIKGYYYYGLKVRVWFAVAGVITALGSLLIPADTTIGLVLSIICGVISFSCLWSIHEVTEQRHRVLRGWFPAGPGHTQGKDPN